MTDPRIIYSGNKINTKNRSFNDAWIDLQKYHVEITSFYPSHALDLSERPKLKDDKEWKYYLSRLVEFLEIGRRNRWVREHVDGKGFIVYYLIDDDVYNGRI